MGFADDLNTAAAAAVCGWLANGGNAVASTFVINGLRTPGAQVPSAIAGLGLLALNAGCSLDPSAGVPPEDLTPEGAPTGCTEVSPGGSISLIFSRPGELDVPTMTNIAKVTKVEVPGGPVGIYSIDVTYVDVNGLTRKRYQGMDASKGDSARFEVVSGECVGTNQPPTGVLPPSTQTINNCTYVVEHEAWVMDDTGVVTPVVKISAGTTRNTGGVIGGCNFDPVIVIPPGGGGGGGGGIYPWEPQPEPPDGPPWWWPIATTAIGNLIAAGIKALVDELLQERAAGRVYRIVSVCEKDDQGDPVSLSREVTIPTLPLLEAAIYRLDALEYLLQGHKDFKQPVCGLLPATRAGEPVTVTFQSDGVSPVSGDSLIKQLKYFDQTGAPLADHAAHWRDFAWRAGDVIVSAYGTPMGKPKVWAESEAEGRRVIEHAAAIAGVDLTGASWQATVSANPRFGQPGLMRVKVSDGALWVTKRPDPSGRPVTLAP